MRTFMRTIPGGLPAVAGLVLAGLFVWVMPLRPQLWLYPLIRQAMVVKIEYQTRDMLARETPHFMIRYTAADSDMVEMVAEAAERAYDPVTTTLQYVPGKKTLILIYPDRQAMKQAYGWEGTGDAMGFYWGGVIQILSPQAWLPSSRSVEEFIATGPLTHEYTHLVLDHLTRGNYARWFTEGLAQYVEYKVNGYEWLTADNTQPGRQYSLKELDGDFDPLANQALAYRQSLAAVRYIAEVHGEAKLGQVLGYLKAGDKTDTAIEKALGLDYAGYETNIGLWAKSNMQPYSKLAY